MTRLRIACGSVTYAEKGKNVLAAAGIRARIVRLEPWESRGGCAYGLETDGDMPPDELRRLLTEKKVRFSEILTAL